MPSRCATRSEGAAREASLATMVLASMAGTATCGFFLSKAYAGITLFIQGLGLATILGYPFRELQTPSSPTQDPTAADGRPTRTGRRGRPPRGAGR